MNKKLLLAKNWYYERPARERILMLLLSWAFLYGLFYLFAFKSTDAINSDLNSQLKILRDQKQSWTLQINALMQISNDPLYKKWVKHHQAFDTLQLKYKNLIRSQKPSDWRNVVQSVLASQKSIVLDQLKDFPDMPYTVGGSQAASNIIEQKHLIVINSNFIDTVKFLQRLEALLPNVRWNTLSYQVTTYPIGETQMEFSVFYEKKS